MSASQLEKFMSRPISPLEVVETDKKCTMQQIGGVIGGILPCAMQYGYEDGEPVYTNTQNGLSVVSKPKEPEVTSEVCSNIRAGVKECILNIKVVCFSKRENKFLTEIIGTAFEDVKEIYAMDEVRKGLEKDMSANQKKLVECAMESGSGSGSGSGSRSGSGSGSGSCSGSGSGRSSLMVGVFLPLLISFFMIEKF